MKDLKDMVVGICNDHAGVEVKNYIIEQLGDQVQAFMNFGTNTTDSCDYPDYAHPMAEAIENGQCDMGIAICGTGNGISMTCNKLSKTHIEQLRALGAFAGMSDSSQLTLFG